DRVAHDADAVRVGDRDRTLEKTALLDPRRAGHLAVAVQREPPGEDRIGIRLSARVDDGDAGADGAPSHHELAFARDERRVADLDARDIGDGIAGARRAVERDAEVAGTRLHSSA